MKRFTWRLQKVLDVKTMEEQVQRAELLKLTEKLVQTQGTLLMEKRILEDMMSDIAEKEPRERLGAQELFLKYSKTSDELLAKLKQEVGHLGLQQKEKIAEVLKLRRFKEGLEKLRAKTKKEFISNQEKLEQKQADERCTMRMVRELQKARS